MSCVYTYNGVDYADKAKLKEAVKKDYLEGKIAAPQKEDFVNKMHVLEGDAQEIEIKRATIEVDAEINFGTEDVVSFIEEDGKTYVRFDYDLMDDIQSGEKTLRNTLTNKDERVNMDKLAAEYRKNNEYPPYENIEYHLEMYFLKKIKDQALNDIMQQKKSDTADTSEQALMNQLVSFANSLGISITTMDLYKEGFKLRTGEDITVNGLADIMRKIIALSNTDNVAHLAEEISHFALEYHHDQDTVRRMLNQVQNTLEYKNEAEKQRQIFSKELSGDALELRVRKEILGKILHKKILDNFDNSTAMNSSEVGIFNLLKQLWQRFKNLFKINDANKKFFNEFGKTLDSMVSDVKNNNFTNYKASLSNEIFYNADVDTRSFITNIRAKIDELIERYQRVSTDTGILKKERLKRLEEIRELMTRGSYYVAAIEYLEVIKADLGEASNKIGAAKRSLIGSNAGPEAFVDELGRVDLLDITTLTNGLGPMLDSLDDLVYRIGDSTNIGLNEGDVKHLRNRVSQVRTSFNNIKNDLDLISARTYKKTWTSALDRFGIQGELRNKFERALTSDTYAEISRIVRWVFSPFAIGNEIFQLVAAMYMEADTNVNRHVLSGTAEMRELQRRYNIPFTQVQKLLKGHHIISPFNMSQFENDYSHEKKEIMKEYIRQVKEIKEDPNLSLQEKEDRITTLSDQNERDINELEKEWFTRPFNDDYYDEFVRFHPLTRQILIDRRTVRKKIFDKYRDPSGQVMAESVNRNDLIQLEAANSRMKAHMSLYYEDGSRKQPGSLSERVAKELIEYNQVPQTGEQDIDTVGFERARRIILNTYGLDSNEYRNWLKVFGRETYEEGIFEDLGSREMRDDFVLELEDELSIKKMLGIPENQNVHPHDLWQMLKDMRSDLVAPYREINKLNEIDGNTIERNLELKDTINRINFYLSKFNKDAWVGIDEAGDTESLGFETIGNTSWVLMYEEMKKEGSVRLQQFLREHTSPYKTNTFRSNISGTWETYRVPSTFHYRTFRPVDENGVRLSPRIEPNYLWSAKQRDDLDRNPNYNEAFKNKARIPNYTNKPEYINEEYFSLFGINRDEVIGPNSSSLGTPTRNTELWEVYQSMLKLKEEIDDIYKIKNQYFLLPQIEADTREVREIGLAGTMKAMLKRTFTVDVDDETFAEYEDIADLELDMEGKRFRSIPLKYRKVIPKRYTQKLGSDKIMSTNISKMYMQYARAGYEYREKTNILPEVLILRDKLANATFTDRSKRNLAPTKGRHIVALMDDFIDRSMYGHAHDQGNIVRVRIGSDKYVNISTTKLWKFFYRWLSKVNLAYNIYVPMVGFVNANVTKRIEAHVGGMTTHGSLNWAIKETSKLLPTYVGDIGSLNPNNKIKKMFEHSGLTLDRNELFDGIYRGRGFRVSQAALDLGYTHYDVFGKITGAQSIFAVYDNYRLYNGEFTNNREFKELKRREDATLTEKQIDEEWNSLKPKSYYNYLVNEEGKPIYINKDALETDGFFQQGMKEEQKDKRMNALEARMRRNALDMHQTIEGLVSPDDRSALQKNNKAMFFAMHRGWLQSAIQSRFKGEHVNIFTGAREEGSYMTAYRLFNQAAWGNDDLTIGGLLSYLVTLGMYSKGVEKLGELEKGNLRRLTGDMMALLFGLAMFILANAAADDDEEDWLKQYMAYIASRSLSEISATQLPTAMNEFYTIVQSPVAGIGMIEDMLNLPALFIDTTQGERVKSGPYKGMPKYQKFLIKKTPMKNLYEPFRTNARRANIFFRHRTLPTWYGEILNAVEGPET